MLSSDHALAHAAKAPPPGDDTLQKLVAMGLLGKIFPPSHVLQGLQVCKWLNKELPEQIESVTLKVRDSGVVSGKQVGTCLCRFSTTKVLLFGSAEARISKHLLEGLCHAVQNDFGSGLVHLNLAHSGYGGEVARTLVKILGKCTNLTHLNVNGNGLMAEAFSPPEEQVTAGIRLCSRLVHLDVGHNSIFDGNPTGLRSVLEDCPDITYLDLSSTEIGAEGMRALSEASNTALLHLSLSDCQMCDDVAELLAGTLSTKWGAIQHLDIGGYKEIHDGSATRLAESLRHCSALTHLDLEDVPCQSSGKELGASLGALRQLTEVSLARAQISDVSACQLATGLLLGGCTSITYLDLDSNEIGSAGARALAAALCQCHGLRVLYLGSNCIQEEGLVDITVPIMMGQWSELEELDLSANRLHDRGVRELIDASRQCPALRVLDISANHSMSDQERVLLNNLGYKPLLVFAVS